MEDLTFILYFAGLMIYFLPTIIARARPYKSLLKVPFIGLLNLLIGWTVVGWFYLLREAFKDDLPVPSQDADLSDGETAPQTAPAKKAGPENENAHPANSEIVRLLEQNGAAKLLHEKSGVRLEIVSRTDAFSIRIPTESLDPRGTRHRARSAVQNAAWRRYEHDPEPAPRDLDENAEFWIAAEDLESADFAANSALSLLFKIADAPENDPVEVG